MSLVGHALNFPWPMYIAKNSRERKNVLKGQDMENKSKTPKMWNHSKSKKHVGNHQYPHVSHSN